MLHLTIPFEEKPKNNLPGDNLKYYRQRKSLTTRQLAEQVDVVPSTILVYEQNKRPIPYNMANRLAEVLDVDVTTLYDDFAAFLSVPYNEALKRYPFGSENVSKSVCGAYRGNSQLLL
ncbi:MAG: helix-turn-helix transcriptional regulator [Butyricicoccus pullicaecorum]|nr:helix-turn-helix transcriptional regulator [Butyricicoccus pullicaecorum]